MEETSEMPDWLAGAEGAEGADDWDAGSVHTDDELPALDPSDIHSSAAVPLAGPDGLVPREPTPPPRPRTPPPPRKPPTIIVAPTTHQINEKFANAIGAKQAKKAMREAFDQAEINEMMGKAANKIAETDPAIRARKVALCMKLNMLRKKVQQKFPDFKWKRNYEPDALTYEFLLQHYEELKTRINMEPMPELFKSIYLQTVGFFEGAFARAGQTQFKGVKSMLEAEVAMGLYDEEFDEWVIDCAEWVNWGYKTRLAGRTAMAFVRAAQMNRDGGMDAHLEEMEHRMEGL